ALPECADQGGGPRCVLLRLARRAAVADGVRLGSTRKSTINAHRVYVACSVTTKSMRPSTRARAHSAGRLTIGSSCTLKLVLTSTGSPVLSRKARRIAA